MVTIKTARKALEQLNSPSVARQIIAQSVLKLFVDQQEKKDESLQ